VKYLIVDDSNPSRKMTAFTLKNFAGKESEILFATNGAGAVEIYKESRPNVVFMDLTMPVMDGYEASELILEYDENAVIIVISADVQQKARERLEEIGVKMFINKPINKDKIKEAFVKIIEGLKDA